MIENKMFLLLFWIAGILLLILLTWNWFSGTEGTYMDHTSMIWDLLGKKVAKPKKAAKKKSPKKKAATKKKTAEK